MGRKRKFAVCVRNEGCEDLEPRKIYELLPDARAAREGYVRVVDESGEDYLYPGDHFVVVDLSSRAKRVYKSRPDLTGGHSFVGVS